MTNNLMNEQAVIGSILISPEVTDIVREKLKPEHMKDPVCKATLEAAFSLRSEGLPVDTVTIADRVQQTYPDCIEYLRDIMLMTPTAANVVAYCNLVKQNAYRDRLQDVANDMLSSVATMEDWISIADRVVNTVKGMTDEESNGVKTGMENFIEFSEYYDETQAHPDSAFCSTGYKDLDEILGGGMFRSGLYIIGARPGMGKTTLGVNVMENMVARGKTVLFVSLEMSGIQIAAKRVARFTGRNYSWIMSGKISHGYDKEIYDACQTLGDRPLYISDRSGLTMSDISALAYQVPNLECIVVDYLGLIRTEASEARKSRYEEITEISGQLKGLAKRLNIPILVLCQLNRENTNRKDKTPLLQDLRDSGAIEQDADAVIFLHRPDYYEGASSSKPEDIQIIVAKNRHAGAGMVKMNWNGTNGQIVEKTAIEKLKDEYRGELDDVK